MYARSCPTDQRQRQRLSAVFLLLVSCGTNPAAGPASQQSARPKDDHDGRYLAYRLQQEGCQPDRAATCCADFNKRLDEAYQRGEAARAARTLQVLATACPELRNGALLRAALQVTPNPTKPSPLRLRWSAQIDPTDRITWAGAFVDGRYQPGGDIPAGPHVLEVELHVMSTGPGEEPAIYRLLGREELTLTADGSRTYQVNLQKQAQATGQDRFLVTIKEDQFLPPSSPKLAEQMKTRATPPSTLVRGKRESYREPQLPREFSGHNRWRALLMVCVDSSGKPESVLPMHPSPHPRMLGVVLDSFLHAKFSPTTFEGEPIPTCHPVNFTTS